MSGDAKTSGEAAAVGRLVGGPMYQQLRGDVLARIRRGEFGPGDYLPSENQLCEQYGVSVTTARRALLELVKEGAVQRKVGVGTMVASRVRQARLAFLSIDYKGDAWRTTPSAMGELLAGIGEYAWQHDSAVSTTGVEEDEAATYLRRLTEERSADGVLLRTANDIKEEYLEILERAGVPYVVIKRDIPGRSMNCVISDDAAGAKMATSHLLDLEHERIGFVCAKPNIALGRERLAGYRGALLERGIAFDEALVRQEPHFTVEMGYRAVKELLESPAPPSAVFVASDTMALGGYEAARDLGWEIPNDLALVGYDDIAPVAVLQPPLTTIRTSYYDFGRLATELLIDLINRKEVGPKRLVIHPTLMERGSAKRAGTGVGSLGYRQSRRPAPSGKPVVADHKRLTGKVVLNAGALGQLAATIARVCEAEGARVLPNTGFPPTTSTPDLAAPIGDLGPSQRLNGHADVDVVFYNFDLLQGDLYASLRQASLYGRAAADRISGRGRASLVYVASLEASCLSPEDAALTAARAGLAQVVKTLATEWAANGARVNALVFEAERSRPHARQTRDLAGPAVFLASDEAAAVSGELLSLGRQPGD